MEISLKKIIYILNYLQKVFVVRYKFLRRKNELQFIVQEPKGPKTCGVLSKRLYL